MLSARGAIYSLLLAILLAPASALWAEDSDAAYPKPSPVPVSWELKFVHSDPKRIVVNIPGAMAPTAYWYIMYSVVNLGESPDAGTAAADNAPGSEKSTSDENPKERIFYPVFTLRTHEGKLIPANDGIHPAVFEAIKQEERNKYLEDPTQMGGKILIGQDQERDSVAIWQEPSQRMGEFTIFASGMWGETAPAKDADGHALKNADGDDILLHKTLLMQYHVDGDQFHFTPVRKLVEEFIMR